MEQRHYVDKIAMDVNTELGEDPLDCLVIGDALCDIIIQLPSEGLRLFEGGTSYCKCISTSCGGSGNVATGVSLLGGTAGFVGTVGKDMIGKLYAKDLESHGVQAILFQDSRLPTGVCLSFVGHEGERTFLVSRAASDCLDSEQVNKVSDLIAQAKMLYVSGYSLVNQPMRAAIFHAVKTATQYGTKVMFDPASHNLIKTNRDVFLNLIENTSFLCLNLEEACALTRRQDLDEIVDSLRKATDLVALKLGKGGCIVATKREKIHIDGEEVPCIDSTGAGDCFASAIAFGLTHNLSACAMGKLGNFLGGYKVQHLGARAFPPKTKIERFLNEIRKDAD